MHQSTLPLVRAAMPAANRAAAAPSTAPFPPTGYFVHSAERQAAAMQARVHGGDSEGQHRLSAPVARLDLLDLRPQGLDGGRRPHDSL